MAITVDESTKSAILVILLLIGYLYKRHTDKVSHERQLADLWETYQNALNSGDKKIALVAGREYYSFIRGGTLSVYDEAAIQNDLLAMSNGQKNVNDA